MDKGLKKIPTALHRGGKKLQKTPTPLEFLAEINRTRSLMDDSRRSKLKFRAWRRGFRELDLLMGSFADETLACMNEESLDEFERLLDIPDWEIFAWLVGQEAVPEKHKGPVLDQLIGFRYAPRGG